MIPIRDTERRTATPLVVILIIVANVAVYLYELSLGNGIEGFVFNWGLIPDKYFELSAMGPSAYADRFLPIYTSMFMHGGVLHIAFNMVFLYIFGDNVEDHMGKSRFLIFYLLCGTSAAYLQLYLSPASRLPMVGASGAIAGVLGGYLVLFPRARVLALVPIFLFFQIVELPAYLFIGFWFVLQFLVGTASLMDRAKDSGGVAYFAHIGGFVAGLILVKLFARHTVAANGNTSG
jgi:membrane associated rhomboid family serine protease